MHVIKATNVGDAFKQALAIVFSGDVDDSRNGGVMRVPMPVTTVYENPTQRVLINPVRRANPFFHLMEAMWMLAGRNDIKFVKLFNTRMSEYSDDNGSTQPAAYGHRWRNHFDWDQLLFAINELQTNPGTRRTVINMWDPNTDSKAVMRGGKDVPCNTSVYFIRRATGELDMTVSCRSNDAIWGAYGANVVHFSILHEFVALASGIPLGRYYHISNDLHVYTDVFSSDSLLKMMDEQNVEYPHSSLPLFNKQENYKAFLADVADFFAEFDGAHIKPKRTYWFNTVVWPMLNVWLAYKAGQVESSISLCELIKAEDWRIACIAWLRGTKQGKKVSV